MHKSIKILLIIGLCACLILVRAFEESLFYDPFLAYFKGNHLYNPIPDVNLTKLFVSCSIRFSVNSVISVLLLIITFNKNSLFKSIAIFYVVAFVILSMLFFGLLYFKIETSNLLLFYIRRFLIQPIFVIVLFPFLYLLQKGYRFDDV